MFYYSLEALSVTNITKNSILEASSIFFAIYTPNGLGCCYEVSFIIKTKLDASRANWPQSEAVLPYWNRPWFVGKPVSVFPSTKYSQALLIQFESISISQDLTMVSQQLPEGGMRVIYCESAYR